VSQLAIRFIDPPEPNDRIVAVEIDGHFTADDMRLFMERLHEITNRGEKALVYQDIQGYEGVDIGAVTEKLKNMGTLWKGIEKIAVVGDTRWMEIYISIIAPITPQQIKHFPAAQKDAAFAWLTG
jgi:hypothetical protein